MNKSAVFVQSKKIDRRVQRTRELLRDALTELILEKGYEETTVQDILDRANLGRSTFYLHYRDKDELLVSQFEYLQQMIREIDAHAPAHHPGRRAVRYSPTLAFFKHVESRRKIYKALVGKQGGEIVQRYLYKYCVNLAGQHMSSLISVGKKPPVPKELVVHFIASSFLSVLSWWLNHDIPCTAEEIDGMYYLLVLPGINAALGKRKRILLQRHKVRLSRP